VAKISLHYFANPLKSHLNGLCSIPFTKNYIDLSVIIFIYLASLTVFVDAYDMRYTLRALLERLSHEVSAKVYKLSFTLKI